MATSVKLDDELKSRIQRLAIMRDRTPHWIMREAIRDYVEREENAKPLNRTLYVPGKRISKMDFM